ncbi:hydrolase [Hyphodiscus hymeniophilus]|uniref:Hydrolase n=1 Tax=Hyphodiscus hymeniophilus TaxID=353542 RepID=A0A9P7AU94_9HELO|nr:hydrolase [Hyphodiscus hymeniophilus]
MLLSSTTVPLLLSSASIFVEARHGKPHGFVPIIRWVDCAEYVPESTVEGGGSFNASTVDLQNLPSTLNCGRLHVPMDYSKPFCDENKITLGVATYRPASPKTHVFFCPGGTDPGVVVAWEVALNLTNAFLGLEDFEIIVMDIRGTQSSNPLNVSVSLVESLQLTPYPQNESEYKALQAASAEAIQSWVNNSSPVGIVEYVGTTEVTQDFEMTRRALDYEKINFLGASYGSFKAQQYAATFPERVGRFVLDAIVPHGLSFHQQAQDDIIAQNRAFERADAYCMSHSDCPFYGQGKGSVIKVFKEVLAMTPFCLPPCTNDTASNNYITNFEIRFAVENSALFAVPDFPSFFELVDRALKGDFSTFAGGAPPSAELLLDIAQAQPIVCSDYDFPKTFEYFNKSLADGIALDITGVGLTAAWLIMASNPSDTVP